MSVKNVLKSSLMTKQDKLTRDNPEEINIQDDPQKIMEAKEGSNKKASPNCISSICQYFF